MSTMNLDPRYLKRWKHWVTCSFVRTCALLTSTCRIGCATAITSESHATVTVIVDVESQRKNSTHAWKRASRASCSGNASIRKELGEHNWQFDPRGEALAVVSVQQLF